MQFRRIRNLNLTDNRSTTICHNTTVNANAAYAAKQFEIASAHNPPTNNNPRCNRSAPPNRNNHATRTSKNKHRHCINRLNAVYSSEKTDQHCEAVAEIQTDSADSIILPILITHDDSNETIASLLFNNIEALALASALEYRVQKNIQGKREATSVTATPPFIAATINTNQKAK